MKTYSLGKRHKLCSKTAIDRLFDRRDSDGRCSVMVYPLRAVWSENPDAAVAGRVREMVQFLISVPKKRLRHAVDRVVVRRRIREAYRLNRLESTPSEGVPVDIAFIYISDSIEPYARIEKSMQRILHRIFPGQQQR